MGRGGAARQHRTRLQRMDKLLKKPMVSGGGGLDYCGMRGRKETNGMREVEGCFKGMFRDFKEGRVRSGCV